MSKYELKESEIHNIIMDAYSLGADPQYDPEDTTTTILERLHRVKQEGGSE